MPDYDSQTKMGSISFWGGPQGNREACKAVCGRSSNVLSSCIIAYIIYIPLVLYVQYFILIYTLYMYYISYMMSARRTSNIYDDDKVDDGALAVSSSCTSSANTDHTEIYTHG